ncbi:Succinyl-CoA-L-malate CoA-transferase beta subunit [Colletotrichum chlorophyti]|uniref:Succinyl-CoA-L-malate CoA-transferase beta subunit n=1 Tax=Colletotrichum chlorophyti TaxID=708187 RepID=A0A1Q8S8U3_9PEZI|nr:Succinyl-CoA-L-malate CoA-transferase beta subunit [Colletotrichum chlorophyti]
MGSIAEYSVPQETEAVFRNGILNNPLMKDLSGDLKSLAQNVKFEGSSKPSVPINWRFAESISALKAFEATMLNRLLLKKYNVDPVNITINTDHASLFYMSPLAAQYLGTDGKLVPMAFVSAWSEEMKRMFPDEDKHRCSASLHRMLLTNMCKTKDGRCYQIHGGINPDPVFTALGLPQDGKPDDTYDTVVERVQKAVAQLDAKELDDLMNETYRQAGAVAWSSDEYFASDQGKAASKTGLYEITKDTHSSQPATWWPENQSMPSSPQRPLAGLKVVDLSRIIAGPLISRGLAEMGASVMRVTSPNVTDMSVLHQDLNWGKWSCHLDLNKEEDKEKLRALIREADVVVDGYRPGVMKKHGFGQQDILNMVKSRDRGIIHVKENCYGWHGPWQHRAGWQQISDAACGVSLAYGQAMGHDEAVTPAFPNSDYCAGVSGTTAVLDALMRRAEHGGSYSVGVALNYYSQWLVRSCGTYPEPVWKELWERHGSPVFRHNHNMAYTVPAILQLLQMHDAGTLFQPHFFEPRTSKAVGGTFMVVKPIAQFSNAAVELRYNVGTRGSGVDEPIWPSDLSVEKVKN